MLLHRLIQSSSQPVLSGVLQGSVFGPLLFHINDLPDSIANVCLMENLFADDVLPCHTIVKEADCKALQTAVSLTGSWSTSNFLAFNTSKCKCMLISRKPSPTRPPTQLQLIGQPLHKVESWVSYSPAICCGQFT